MVTDKSIRDIRAWADKKCTAAREKYDNGETTSLTVAYRYEDIVDICNKADEALTEADDERIRRKHNIEVLTRQVPDNKSFSRADVIAWMGKCIM